MKRPVVAILTSSEGHYSLAQAAQQALAADYEVVIFKRPLFMQSLYKIVYRFLPRVYIVPFLAGKNKQVIDFVEKLAIKKHLVDIQKFMTEHQPEVCINTYFMYLKPLDLIRKNQPFFSFNILADPRSIHPILIADPPTINLSFDQAAEKLCQQYEPASLNQAAGWLVQTPFEEPYDRSQIHRELNLNPERFTVLITGGSEGSATVLKLISQLKNLERPAHLIVACGTNRLLLQEVKRLSKKHSPDSNVSIECLGFTTHMSQYMKAADIVVGKAGPNTIFEAVATHTPFMAVTHISGQEDGNLDLIKEYQLGYVEEETDKASRLLQDIINHPEQLETFQPQLQHTAAYNRRAKQLLLKTVQQQLHP